jgi:hypothetical protein
MTNEKYKQLKKIINKAIEEIDEKVILTGEALRDDYNERYNSVVNRIKEEIITRAGFDFEEYLEKENEERIERKNKREKPLIDLENKINDRINEITTLSKEDVEEIVAQNIKPPQIINNTVKEIVREKPQIIKETVREIDNSSLKDLRSDLVYLQRDHLDLYEKIPKIHSDLSAIGPDDHHLEIHSLDSHLNDEWMEQFKRLIKEYKPQEYFGEGIGSGFRVDEIWKAKKATKEVSLRKSDYTFDISIGKFADVDITGVLDNQILKWQTDKFIVGDLDLSPYAKLTDTNQVIRSKEHINVNSGTIERTGDYISKVTIGGREVVITRDTNNDIASWTDSINTWTLTRVGGKVTGWNVV